MRTHIAIIAGKLIHQTIKVLNYGGGSAAPGLYALKIDPKLIESISKQVPTSIMITGTNGKTTTAKMLAQFAEQAGIKTLRNATGSNLERGIASALLHRKSNQKLAIWEVDEAAFNVLAPKIRPQLVIFLNIFRDQLDRYGEIDTVLKKWALTVNKLPKSTHYLINGSDPNLLQLSQQLKGRVTLFGINNQIIKAEKKNFNGHAPKLNIAADQLKLDGLNGSSFNITSNGAVANVKTKVNLPLPGKYHIYDFLAALAAGLWLKIPTATIKQAIADYSPAFGRVEKIDLSSQNPKAKEAYSKKSFAYIFLIKNPYGASQVLETIKPVIKPGDIILTALNDNLADGTDVSWIWDTEWEQLSKTPASFIVSGTRAEELALRLKYAGIDPKKIIIEDNTDSALKLAIAKTKGTLFILPTYTWLLDLQKTLTKQGFKEAYWKNHD